MPYSRAKLAGRFDRAPSAVLAVSGALLSLVGFVLAVGGWLSFEGSALDILIGLGLIVSGSLLSTRHRAGAWTYLLLFAGTVSWSLRNIAAGLSPVHRFGGRSAARDADARSSDRLDYPIFGNERTPAMIYDWQTSLRASDYYAARIVPPATVEETGWDILLALHSDRNRPLSIGKLASIVSGPGVVIDRWLGVLEERELITGVRHPSSNELLAMLTQKGRELLDRYFSVTSDLQVGAPF